MPTPTPAYVCKDRLIGDGVLFNMGRVLKKNIEARRNAPSARRPERGNQFRVETPKKRIRRFGASCHQCQKVINYHVAVGQS